VYERIFIMWFMRFQTYVKMVEKTWKNNDEILYQISFLLLISQ